MDFNRVKDMPLHDFYDSWNPGYPDRGTLADRDEFLKARRAEGLLPADKAAVHIKYLENLLTNLPPSTGIAFKTLEGRDWGWDAGQYIGAVFHTARTIQTGVHEDACVFISDIEINVYINTDDIDMDSTDINPFRQYSRHVTNIVASIKECETLAAKLHGSNLNTIDRELIRMYGFTRII